MAFTPIESLFLSWCLAVNRIGLEDVAGDTREPYWLSGKTQAVTNSLINLNIQNMKYLF